MDVVLHETAADFWQVAESLYAADPVRHTIALTVVPPLIEARREAQDHSPQPLLLTIVERGAVIGAAFRTPPWPIGVSGIPAVAAPVVVDFLIDRLPDKARKICGASGPQEQVNEFAASWAARTGDTVVESMAQRLYRLDSLATPNVAGEFRFATVADVPLLGAWRRSFVDEVHPVADDPEWPVAALGRSLARQNPHVIWNVDGVPVAYAAGNRPVHGMSRIGPVYTPPEHRNHGYGSAATAAASQWTIDNGAEDVLLFTDLSNPTSNSIYQKLGYRPVYDAVECRFEAPNPYLLHDRAT